MKFSAVALLATAKWTIAAAVGEDNDGVHTGVRTKQSDQNLRQTANIFNDNKCGWALLDGNGGEDSCSADGDDGDNTPYIIDGVLATDSVYDAVVSLHQLSRDQQSVYRSPFCTGTLIRNNIVLTAAHCLEGSKKDPVFTNFLVYTGYDPTNSNDSDQYIVSNPDRRHMTVDAVIHPQYNSRRILNDIALVKLEKAVTTITPIANVDASTSALVTFNADIEFAGFGQNSIRNPAPPRRLKGLGEITGFTSDPGISYGQTQGPCFGDSGGPAFVFDGDGTRHVAGVTSYGDSNCAVYGVSTEVSEFEGWINDYISGGGVGGDCSDYTSRSTCRENGCRWMNKFRTCQ